jgi:mannose-6-phosphate isomerase-like protein (cupin superfamily)
MADKGKLLRLDDFQPFCPPKHSNTDCYPLVTNASCGAENLSFMVVDIHPGGMAEEATHSNPEHGYFLLSGIAIAKVEGEEFILKPHDCLWIPKATKHEIKPQGDQAIRFVVFSAPPK